MLDSLVIKKVLVFIFLNISIGNGQDILLTRRFQKFKSVSTKLDSLMSAFLVEETDCIDWFNKHTAASLGYYPDTKTDTNRISLGVTPVRSLAYEDYVGYLTHEGYDIFLHRGAENLELLEKEKIEGLPREFEISVQVIYSNYLLKDNDTVFLVGPELYSARWSIWHKDTSYMKVADFKLPCEFKHREKWILNMIESGEYRMPGK